MVFRSVLPVFLFDLAPSFHPLLEERSSMHVINCERKYEILTKTIFMINKRITMSSGIVTHVQQNR